MQNKYLKTSAFPLAFYGVDVKSEMLGELGV